jgi:hypothetical protein
VCGLETSSYTNPMPVPEGIKVKKKIVTKDDAMHDLLSSFYFFYLSALLIKVTGVPW